MKTSLDNISPLLHRKYLSIMFTLGIVLVLSPSYLTSLGLWIVIALGGLIALLIVGLYRGFFFQKIYRKLRPYIVTRIAQILSITLSMIVLALTLPLVIVTWEWLPHIVYWCLMLAVVVQFFGIFSLARDAKEKYPDRCEFC